MPANSPWLGLLLGAGYLVVGGLVALHLHRRGHSPGTAVSAIAAWPLLLGLGEPSGEPAPRVPRGPLAQSIDEAFSALEESLDDPQLSDLPQRSEIAMLRQAVGLADARVDMVDRLLGDERLVRAGREEDLDALRGARERAVDEIEGVLAGVVQLRIQVGLVALAGDTEPVRAHLALLQGRVKALEEVARLPSLGRA